MAERIDTVVIGGGQAGLATSYHLSRVGVEHIVLERGRVGETWRTERWDGFYLNTPNWTLDLPGHGYRGPEPDAFAPLAEVIVYFEDYARAVDAPVREGVEVRSLRRQRDGYLLETDTEPLRAGNVVVATGAFQRRTPTELAAAVPAYVLQLHTSEYRNPEQLAEGGVLIVGGGQSGCQIADELNQAGRRTYLAVGRCPWFPRRYRGREIMRWAVDSGLSDETVDKLPSPAARLACNPPVSGNDGGHDCNPRWLARRGTVLLGRLTGFRDGTAVLAPGLAETLAFGDEFVATLTGRLDQFIEAAGLDLPDAEPAEEPVPVPEREELDLAAEEIGTIIWANGFRPDLGWIELPLPDEWGWPVQTRGVTEFPGLYFIGLNWLHKRKSALLLGVGEDAEYVAEHAAAR